jgi:hypothetical protein
VIGVKNKSLCISLCKREKIGVELEGRSPSNISPLEPAGEIPEGTQCEALMYKAFKAKCTGEGDRG